jgi:hypothetical protein
MTTQYHPGEDNILSLRQGVELIRRLDVATYAGPPEDRSGVGSQFRHCVDFYDCFLRGLAEGRVDYNHRDRDRRVAKDPLFAIARIEQVIEALSGLEPDDLDAELSIRLERASPIATEREWCRSTVLRELQFLFSHTIHHYALIANLLSRQGLEVDPTLDGFGVAPSTRDYWKETDRPQPRP